MIDIKQIRENPEILRKDLVKRHQSDKIEWIDQIKSLDETWIIVRQDADKLRHKRNELSKQINEAKKGERDATAIIDEAKDIPSQIIAKEEEIKIIRKQIDEKLMDLPNIMHESVPEGKDESENKEVRRWGEPLKKELKNHAELAEEKGLVDFESSAKVSGSGFYYLKGELGLLNQALIRFAIDHMLKKGFDYIEPPLMLKKEAYAGVTGLSDFEDVMYKIEGEDMYLIATAEHPLVAMLSNEIIDLPVKLVGYSMSFRKEVGSHGIDTKGLFRTHQFNKVEQVVMCKPEESWKYFEEMQAISEEIFQALKLPYRVLEICAGDLGGKQAKQYDIEVWFPRQNAYKEVTSCSNCTDYQARRANIRYEEHGIRKYVHTLNNTALATSRAMVAILENYQNDDGSITVPEVLVPYMGITVIKGKSKKSLLGGMLYFPSEFQLER